MAAVKIRVGGSKPKAKPADESKPTRKSSTRKSTAKPASSAKAKATPAKRGPGRPRKQEGEPTRRNSTGVDPKLEARLLKAIQKAGDRRTKAKIEHEESVNALYEVTREAMNAGVSMAKISDASDISRQWLYKMGEFAGRKPNGNGASAPKEKAAPKAASKKPTARKSTRTSGRGSTAKKSTSTKPRIRTAS